MYQKLIVLSMLTMPLNSQGTDGVIQALHHYTWYASYAVCNDTQLYRWSCKQCNEVSRPVGVKIFSNEDTGTRGYMAVDRNNHEIIISFRGTSNLPNYAYDLNSRLVPFKPARDPNVKVHEGFLLSEQSLESKFIPLLKKALFRYRGYTVIFTGHSLGGAMASLAAAKIYTDFDVDVELFTYGQPKTGNREFVDWYHKQDITKFRVVSKNDRIPHIKTLDAIGYHHHNNEVWITDSGRVRFCNDRSIEDKKCSMSVPSDKLTQDDHVKYFTTSLGPDFC